MIVNGLFKSVNDKEMRFMAYKIAVVDDEENDLKHVSHHISDFFSSTNIQLNTYRDALCFPINTNFDVLFLDIDMPQVSGLELAKEYKKRHQNALIIFITSHNELVYKACNIHPFDFIRKENLDKEMPDVLEEINYQLSHLYPSVTFYINGNAYVLKKELILYCESFNHQTEIHFDTSSITVNMQLGDVERTIDSNHFKRVGRSYLVNMKKVTKLEGTTLYISEHHQIPISRRKKKLVLEYMKKVQQ